MHRLDGAWQPQGPSVWGPSVPGPLASRSPFSSSAYQLLKGLRASKALELQGLEVDAPSEVEVPGLPVVAGGRPEDGEPPDVAAEPAVAAAPEEPLPAAAAAAAAAPAAAAAAVTGSHTV